MKRFFARFASALVLVAIALPATAGAAEDPGALLGRAIDDLVRNGYIGDTSAAQRYLTAVLEQEPDNLEAQWQILFLQTNPLKNMHLYDRTEGLAVLSPEFERLIQAAAKGRQEAFQHYMTAIHAGYYNDYPRALAEIDRSIALEKDSARYLTAKGRALIGSGAWNKDDAQVEAGMATLKEARALLKDHPTPFVRDEFFDFYLADGAQSFVRPRWDETAGHYQRFLEKAEGSALAAFAWNNLSIAYRKTGACDRALEAADKALAIMKFGAAEDNKRKAHFCVETQKSGVMTAAR